VDRLIALVGLRLRLELRALSRARERAMGLLLMVPGLLMFAAAGSFVVFFGVRALAGAAPDALLPALSAGATALGLFWVLSPLLTGVAFSEAHDMSRLLHFPIPLRTLAASSLLANLAQPMALAAVPILVALALAAAGAGPRFPAALLGAVLTFVFILAAAQVCGLVLHGLARRRRFRDLALFLGLGFGFALSLGPVLLLSAGPRPVRALARAVVDTPLLALSPFAWGVRAAVHAGRGEWLPFAVNAGAAVVAVAAAVAAAATILQRVHRGEVDLGQPGAGAGRAARMWMSGAIGALLEKDLRMTWRDPALKATLFMGLVGPLLFLVFLSQTGARGGAGTGFLLLATFVGISAFGSNAFGFERRGIALLLGFPVERWRILVGKNAGAILLRLPGLVVLLAAGAVMAPLPLLPAAATIAAVTLILSAGADNFPSILFPTVAPGAGRNPYGGAAAGGRGLGGMLLGLVLLTAALLLSSPFVFLAWLPLLLERPWLWALTLPLALAGAVSVYAMLVTAASRILERREPELMERILGED
jgi:ABC-2 type transport system permease protein